MNEPGLCRKRRACWATNRNETRFGSNKTGEQRLLTRSASSIGVDCRTQRFSAICVGVVSDGMKANVPSETYRL
jgi:hypothetical protein